MVFESVKSAKACVEKLNNTSVMGKVLHVFLDAFGKVTSVVMILCFIILVLLFDFL